MEIFLNGRMIKNGNSETNVQNYAELPNVYGHPEIFTCTFLGS